MLFYIVSLVRTFFLERVPLCLFLGSEAWRFLSSAAFTVGTASGFGSSFRFPTKFNEDKNSGECGRIYESLRKCFEHKLVYFDGTNWYILMVLMDEVFSSTNVDPDSPSRLFVFTTFFRKCKKVYFLFRIIFAITIAAINRTKHCDSEM